MNTLIALFLIAHGLIHAGLAAAPDPGDPDSKAGAFFTSPQRSWLFSKLGINQTMAQWIGIGLVVFSALGFVLAGLGLFGVPGLDELWRSLSVGSAIISLLLLLLFWHPWLILGVLIDLAIIISLLWAKWPPAGMLGY